MTDFYCADSADTDETVPEEDVFEEVSGRPEKAMEEPSEPEEIEEAREGSEEGIQEPLGIPDDLIDVAPGKSLSARFP